MAIAIGMEFVNLKEVKARLATLGPKGTVGLGRALNEFAEDVATEAKDKYVPIHLGTLRDSIHALPPKISGVQVETAVVAGGPAAPYARIVHEDLRPKKWHKAGTGPKYIERPLLAGFGQLRAKLMESLDRILKEL